MQKKILLADDNQLVRLITKALLESEGFSVDLASDGQEAFLKFSNSQYHLILMDIQMPVQDGIATARLIRNHEFSNGLIPLPILAYSSRTSESSRGSCIDAGMNDHIFKPADAKKLLYTIQKWLR